MTRFPTQFQMRSKFQLYPGKPQMMQQASMSACHGTLGIGAKWLDKILVDLGDICHLHSRLVV